MLILEPLFKLLTFKFSTRFSWGVILSNLLSRTRFIDVIDFWFIFPLAGILLLKINKVTFIFFNLCLIYIIYTFFNFEPMSWPYYSVQPHLYSYVTLFLSILLLISFLLPDLRNPFFDQRLRWWESKARYLTDIKADLIMDSHESIKVTIVNISLTGALLRLEEKKPQNISSDRAYHLEFEWKNRKKIIPVSVMRFEEDDQFESLGVRFSGLHQRDKNSRSDKKFLKDMVKELGAPFR